MIGLNKAKRIRVTWVYETEIYLYESVPESIVPNAKPETLRFELRDVIGNDDNFQVVIQKDSDSYTFKADYYQNAEQKFPLTAFMGQNELILYYEGTEGRAYFHVTR